MNEPSLNNARERIDRIDRELQRLIGERASIAQEVARIKSAGKSAGELAELTFYRPEREAEVLRRAMANNDGPLDDATVARLMREVMSACLALEAPLSVAYLGPRGTYTEAAVGKHFGQFVVTKPLVALDEIFREVEAGRVHFGVVPVENSTEGVVSHTLDLLVATPLSVCGEVALPVHHHLLSLADGLSAVRRVYGHAQSLAQSRKWLDAKLAGVERLPVSSNAEAARRAAEQPEAAAIAARAAADVYHLEVLAGNIEDEPDNTTRFVVVGRHQVPASGNDMTSLVLSGGNRPGLLHDLLRPFAEAGVNLMRIESRPSRRANWDYNFFIDIQGHAQDDTVARVLQQVGNEATFLKVLGAYPRAVV